MASTAQERGGGGGERERGEGGRERESSLVPALWEGDLTSNPSKDGTTSSGIFSGITTKPPTYRGGGGGRGEKEISVCVLFD